MKNVAVLIPCFNEGPTLLTVINDFKKAVPEAVIYVYDNGSTDDSVQIANQAGVVIHHVASKGKGNVIRRMFADISADHYIMVDGDATYDASRAPEALKQLEDQQLDMVVCTREPVQDRSFPKGHQLGNRVFTYTVNLLFGNEFTDIFSGYRVFSKRFVKSFPAISQGFELEAEISIHALQLSMPIAEIKTLYHERPQGSLSKLKTIRDGIKILRTIMLLFIYIQPMAVFGLISLMLAVTAIGLGIPIIFHFINTGLVPRIPTTLLAASLGILACISLGCGIILDSVSRSRLEMKRCWYLLCG